MAGSVSRFIARHLRPRRGCAAAGSISAAEKRNGDVVPRMIHAGTATAVHDSLRRTSDRAGRDGNIASGIGAQAVGGPPAIVPHAWWFGEDQARYIVTVRAEDPPTGWLAKMKGGCACVRNRHHRRRYDRDLRRAPVSIASLNAGFEGWFPAYMNASAA